MQIQEKLAHETKVAAKKRLYWALAFAIESTMAECNDMVVGLKELIGDESVPAAMLVAASQKVTEKTAICWGVFHALEEYERAFNDLPEFTRFLFTQGCDKQKALEYSGKYSRDVDASQRLLRDMAKGSGLSEELVRGLLREGGIRGQVFGSKFAERSLNTVIKGEVK